MLILTMGCSDTQVKPIKCLSNYISANIEKEKVKDFVKLEGLIIWREGWTNLTAAIAEDHFVIDNCDLREYLTQFNLSIDEIKGQMLMVYSVHSYLKYGRVNLKSIRQKVDSLYYLEYEVPREG
jgi:hypothetical protein